MLLLLERLDIAVDTYSYHVDASCYRVKDPFWGNKDAQTMLLRMHSDEHASSHRKTCFKKVSDSVVAAIYCFHPYIELT